MSIIVYTTAIILSYLLNIFKLFLVISTKNGIGVTSLKIPDKNFKEGLYYLIIWTFSPCGRRMVESPYLLKIDNKMRANNASSGHCGE